VIRFACPRCKTVIERADHEAGAKFSCTGCGQRLQVPGSVNKTAPPGAANWDWVGGAVGVAPVADAPPPGDVQVRLVRGREHITWPCPLCHTQVSVALDLCMATVRCPQCTKRIDVPRAPESSAQQFKTAPAPDVLPVVEPPRRFRGYDDDSRDGRREDYRDDYDDRPRRRRSRYEDDDYEPRIRRYTASGRPASEEECARSSTTGFLCAVIGIALLLVAAIIWVVMVAEGPRGQASPLVFLILLIGIISFVLGLIGVVFSSRGLDPINQRNRGIAVAGLVCGILGMVVGLIGSIFFFCIGLVLMSRPF
jgi:hypothetical protein